MKAKAMVAVAPDQLELQEYEIIPPAEDQILMKLGATSVCASDPKILAGKVPLMDRFPLILGHEIAGEVAAIGETAADIHQLKEGDRITVEPMLVCGRCEWCRTEFNYHKCRPLRAYGATMTADRAPFLFGGYAEYMYLLPGTLPHKIDKDVPFASACLSSVIGNGVRWIKYLGQMTYGQSLVISGVGSQGLAALIMAKECGVGPIAMLGLDRDCARFDLAKEFGAEHTINIEAEDPLKAVPDLLGGAPDVIVETSGVPSAIQTALELVKMTGKVIVIGVSGGAQTPINFDALVVKGVRILADHAQAGNVHDAVRIINSQKYAIEKINNVSYCLEELPKALAATADPPEEFIKGVVVFS